MGNGCRGNGEAGPPPHYISAPEVLTKGVLVVDGSGGGEEACPIEVQLGRHCPVPANLHIWNKGKGGATHKNEQADTYTAVDL